MLCIKQPVKIVEKMKKENEKIYVADGKTHQKKLEELKKSVKQKNQVTANKAMR